jgi:hypothetical protein
LKFRLLALAAIILGAYPALSWWSQASQPSPAQPAPIIVTGRAETETRPVANLPTPQPTTAPVASAAALLLSVPAASAVPSPRAVAQIVEPDIVLPAPFFEPAGCQAPPEDYTRVFVHGWWLNQRTLAMLKHAAELYGGSIDITGTAIIQGSYSRAGWGRFNTGSHLGGGAVDLSVRPGHVVRPLYHELEPLLNALRVAGFAAWLRDHSELFMGPDLHIHAVAIGDKEQSPEAAAELTGPFGYFRGYSGMPGPEGAPELDPRGGPVLCQWMRDAGYADLSQAAESLARPANWREKLKLAASAYLANSVGETFQVAYRLDWLPGKSEDPSTMCGPLAAAILRDAGLLPPGIAPLNDIKNFWLAKPRENGRPWIYFPARNYDLAQFDAPINQFDFAAWPLLPADIVYTYQWASGYEHLFVVTEVDAEGRAYTVTNNPLPSGSFMVQRVLLYDPHDPTVGALKTDWVQGGRNGRTGMAGFDVLRQRGATLPAGSRYVYIVRPGDTLQNIAPIFDTTLESIVAENQLTSPYGLAVGQTLVVMVGAQAKPAGPAPTPEPTATEPSLPYDVAALAKVVLTTAQAARVRFEPNGVIIDAVRDGEPVQVLYGRRLVDNILWLQVRLQNGVTGWMAGSLLQMTDLNPAR